MTDIVIFAGRPAHHQQWCGAFAAGLDAHGVSYKLRDNSSYVPCDLAVFWSHRPSHIINAQRQAGADYLVLERGFIGDRQKFTSTGFNGLCGRANWHVKNDLSRFNKHHKSELKPWRSRGKGKYILVMGQVRGDLALNNIDFPAWLESLKPQLEKFDLPVKFRPHPLDGNMPTPFDSLGGDLSDALEDAEFVVTLNSTVGVECVLSGVPTVTLDHGSMAWGVSGHDLEDLPPRNARLEWASKLAWCQWKEEEFRSGEAWEHLKGFL